MKQKKICLLGSFAVGKTSLVRRFVHAEFSDDYLTTIGVKIDKKEVIGAQEKFLFLLWDIAGEDRFHTVSSSYFRGCAGYLLVIDGCRRDTLDQAQTLDRRLRDAAGEVPGVLAVNKHDLVDDWQINEQDLTWFHERGLLVVNTSAKTGAGVEEAFSQLAHSLG